MHARKSIVSIEGGGSPLLKAGVILGLTVLTLLGCWLVPPAKPGGEAGVDMYLPVSVGPFRGFNSNHEPSQAERDILPPDTSYAKMNYSANQPGGDKLLNCSIVLSGAEKRSIHRPERCLPAQGWRIEDTSVVGIPLASGRTLKVTALRLNRNMMRADGTPVSMRCYFLYWFVGKDVTTPSHLQRLLLTNWEMLAHRINQRWAYVIVQAEIPEGEMGSDAAQTLDVMKQFIRDSVPYYMKSEMAAKSATN